MTNEPTTRRPRRWPWIFAVVAALLLSACSTAEPTTPVPTAVGGPVDVPDKPKVSYFVTSSSTYGDDPSVSVTYSTPDGTQQATNVATPLRNRNGSTGVRFHVDSGQFLYISAQNNEGYGSVECRIEVDGVTVSENESVGGYAIATCEGVVP